MIRVHELGMPAGTVGKTATGIESSKYRLMHGEPLPVSALKRQNLDSIRQLTQSFALPKQVVVEGVKTNVYDLLELRRMERKEKREAKEKARKDVEQAAAEAAAVKNAAQNAVNEALDQWMGGGSKGGDSAYDDDADPFLTSQLGSLVKEGTWETHDRDSRRIEELMMNEIAGGRNGERQLFEDHGALNDGAFAAGFAEGLESSESPADHLGSEDAEVPERLAEFGGGLMGSRCLEGKFESEHDETFGHAGSEDAEFALPGVLSRVEAGSDMDSRQSGLNEYGEFGFDDKFESISGRRGPALFAEDLGGPGGSSAAGGESERVESVDNALDGILGAASFDMSAPVSSDDASCSMGAQDETESKSRLPSFGELEREKIDDYMEQRGRKSARGKEEKHSGNGRAPGWSVRRGGRDESGARIEEDGFVAEGEVVSKEDFARGFRRGKETFDVKANLEGEVKRRYAMEWRTGLVGDVEEASPRMSTVGAPSPARVSSSASRVADGTDSLLTSLFQGPSAPDPGTPSIQLKEKYAQRRASRVATRIGLTSPGLGVAIPKGIQKWRYLGKPRIKAPNLERMRDVARVVRMGWGRESLATEDSHAKSGNALTWEEAKKKWVTWAKHNRKRPALVAQSTSPKLEDMEAGFKKRTGVGIHKLPDAGLREGADPIVHGEVKKSMKGLRAINRETKKIMKNVGPEVSVAKKF